jgi:predicted transcriptional regulator
MYTTRRCGAQKLIGDLLDSEIARFFVVLTGPAESPLARACASRWSFRIALSSYTIMVYNDAMAVTKQKSKRNVRRSVTLPPEIARQVDSVAKQRRLSDNRVLVELIEQGIEARQQKERAFLELAERFRAASDPEEVKRLGDELGRFVFGE